MMDEQQFQTRCDEAMNELYQALVNAAEQHEFDADQNNGTITVEFEAPPAKFVVSPNSPVRQIWISALVKSFKLDWNDGRSAFVLKESGESLRELMGSVIGQQLSEEVEL